MARLSSCWVTWGKGLRFHYQGRHIIQIDELSLKETTHSASVPSDSFQTIQRVRYQYDRHNDLNAAGQLTEHIDGLLPEPDQQDPQSQLLQHPKALVTTFKRNNPGQLIEKITADDESSLFDYNPMGQLSRVQNPHSTVTFDYDVLGSQPSSPTQTRGNRLAFRATVNLTMTPEAI